MLKNQGYLKRRLGLWLMALIAIVLVSVVALPTQAQVTYPFNVTNLDGESSENPTSLEFGPDSRLYVAQQNGVIFVYTIERDPVLTDYNVIATEEIDLIKFNTPNHNDDGTPNSTTNRQVTGLVMAGTATNPVIYVSSSDWRISVGNDTGLDTNSGVISRLTCPGGVSNNACQGGWDKVDIVRGLPRSEENHSTNGMDIDPNTNTLYVMSGGHANKGAPGNNFSGTPEYYLSAALLSVNLNQIDAMPIYTDPRNGAQYVYDLPTLNDPTRQDIDNTSSDFPYTDPSHPLHNATIDLGDPFGGGNSLNQAISEPGGPVQVYSPGYRNAYDVVFTESGHLYTSDNGPNGGWGGLPLIYDSNGNLKGHELQGGVSFDAGAGDYCTNEFNEDGSNGHGDNLHFIDSPGYYGGHPTPIRAFPELSKLIVYEEQNGQWVITQQAIFSDLLNGVSGYFNTQLTLGDFPDNPIECDYLANSPGSGQVNILDTINSSTNGIAEYTASNFNGDLQGNILTASFNETIYRYTLNAAGDAYENKDAVGQGNPLGNPLDVTTQGDGEIFPGTIWVGNHGADTITIYEPDDFAPFDCTGDDDDTIDEDGDGYTNADEIDNGTDPCSQGSQPADSDGTQDFGQFLRSDLNDPDDDNDGIIDEDDAFVLDADNGLQTSLPVFYEFELEPNSSVPDITVLGLGFTGLMINNTTNWLDQYDPADLNTGGATGELGIENVTAGDAAADDQENGFQFGVNVDENTNPFVAHTQVESPFFYVNGNPATPADSQSFGLQIGTGDQDNYLKVVMNANGGNGGVLVGLEVNGSYTETQYGQSDIGGDVLAASEVDLYIEVYPNQLQAQPMVSVDGGNTKTALGNPISIPAGWLSGSDNQGLAAGVISTSAGADPFGVTWDFFYVYELPSDAQAIVTVDTSGLNGSTFNGDTFLVENTSQGGVEIDSVTIDLSSGIIPEVVFDPNGTAGDGNAKGFTPTNGSDATTGVTNSDFGSAYEGGFYELSVGFNDFQPGETLSFNIDVDPVSIKGGAAPGPNNSGSVSGLELTGATATVSFSNGDVHTIELFQDSDDPDSDSTNVARNQLPSQPSIQMVDVPNQSTVFTAEQVIEVNATTSGGQTVKVLHLEAGLFVEDLTGPYAGVGYDIDSWEVNSVIAVQEYTLNGSGTVNVTLTDNDPEAGYNIFAAVVVDPSDGATSNVSDVVIVNYDPDAAPSTLYRVNAEQETIPATDGGPDWIGVGGAGAQSGDGWAVNTGNISTHNITGRDASVPDYAPQALFAKERWDPPADSEMLWTFDVTPGTYAVRLYMGNGFGGTSGTGARVFDINIEGNLVRDNLDLSAEYGHQVGAMEEFIVQVADNSLEIEFIHQVENPLINAIEILAYDGDPDELSIQVATIADQLNAEGTQPTVDVQAQGGDGNLSYNAVGLPPGIELEPTNGDLYGTVQVGASTGGPNSDGVYPVQIIVDDSDGNTDDAVVITFNWTITDPGEQPERQVLYRINNGGPEVAATDGETLPNGEPANWTEDQTADDARGNAQLGTPSPYLTLTTDAFDQTFGANLPGQFVNNTSLPDVIFATERFSEAANPDNMQWDFPVANGTYEVNLFMAEVWSGAQNDTTRQFDIFIEGDQKEDNFVIFTAFGGYTADVLSYEVAVSDGNLDVDFGKTPANNPKVSAIEVVQLNPPSDNSAPTLELVQDPPFDPSGSIVILAQGETLTVDITATDPDVDDTLTLSAQLTKNGLVYEDIETELIDNGDGTGTYTVTPGLNTLPDYFTIEIVVSDGSVDIDSIFFLEVTSAPSDDMAFDFGDVDFGTGTAGQPITQTLTLTNKSGELQGNQVMLFNLNPNEVEVMELGLTGTDADNFTILENTINPPLPAVLPNDASLTFNLEFVGQQPGTYNAQVQALVADENGNTMITTANVSAEVTEPTGGSVLFRVNAGGLELPAADGSLPNWGADTSTNPSPYLVVAGSGNIYPTNVSNVISVTPDSSVPASAPVEMFGRERWDNTGGNGLEMKYGFPVDPGTQVEVRLYFAEIFVTSNGITGPDQRVFDVSVEGTVPSVFDNLDPYAEAGDVQIGFMRSFQTTVNDNLLEIEFLHDVIENPAIKGIEIIELGTGSENTAPVITAVDDVTYGVLADFNNPSVVESTGRFVVSATDPEQDNITFSATGLPDGLTINPTTGEIEGIIAVTALTGGPNSDGVHNVVITATDDGTPTASSTEEFTLTVIDRTITITAPTGTIPATDTLTVTWTSEGGDTSGYFDHVHLYWYPAGASDIGDKLGSQPLNGTIDLSQGVPSNSPAEWATYFDANGNLIPGDYVVLFRHAKPNHDEYVVGTDQYFSEMVTFTVVDTSTTASLTGSLTIQGRTDYSGSLTVEMYAVGAATPSDTFNVSSDSSGSFTVSGITPGDYEIAVKHPNTLQVVETITLAEGANTANFGELRVGDANDDNIVNGVDFSVLVTTFNVLAGDASFDARADFNADDIVDGVDFSLLVTNFNVAGEEPSGTQ